MKRCSPWDLKLFQVLVWQDVQVIWATTVHKMYSCMRGFEFYSATALSSPFCLHPISPHLPYVTLSNAWQGKVFSLCLSALICRIAVDIFFFFMQEMTFPQPPCSVLLIFYHCLTSYIHSLWLSYKHKQYNFCQVAVIKDELELGSYLTAREREKCVLFIRYVWMIKRILLYLNYQ